MELFITFIVPILNIISIYYIDKYILNSFYSKMIKKVFKKISSFFKQKKQIKNITTEEELEALKEVENFLIGNEPPLQIEDKVYELTFDDLNKIEKLVRNPAIDLNNLFNGPIKIKGVVAGFSNYGDLEYGIMIRFNTKYFFYKTYNKEFVAQFLEDDKIEVIGYLEISSNLYHLIDPETRKKNG